VTITEIEPETEEAIDQGDRCAFAEYERDSTGVVTRHLCKREPEWLICFACEHTETHGVPVCEIHLLEIEVGNAYCSETSVDTIRIVEKRRLT
jgi:hypothetical protein